VPSLVTAAAVGAGVLIVLNLAPPARERAVTSAQPQDLFERHFAVFRRPPTAADKVSVELVGGMTDVEVHASRLVARDGEARAYLVAAQHRGRPQLCSFLQLPGDDRAMGCGSVRRLLERGELLATSTTPGRVVPGWLLAIVPDGVSEVRITLSDRSIVRRAVRNNAVLVGASRPVAALSWTDTAGRRYTRNLLD
jgi:hypothetical protein